MGEIAPPTVREPGYKWYLDLNRYHWFVFIVAALGWLFDTMDQQLFTLARMPAMRDLIPDGPNKEAQVQIYGGYATAVFLVGWATGGIFFGMLGDRWGRAKVMLWTILIYSLCTGLSAFSIGFWDFAFYRFLTGLGVGGEFAVGVSLVAEVMPNKARPYALGLLQALSAVGNVTAALVSIGLGSLEQTGVVGSFEIQGIRMTAWRLMFMIGTVPALLAIVIRSRLKEPETWQKAVKTKAGQATGSLFAIFAHPVYRHNAIVGLALATSGVIGLWGIGFFSSDLTRLVFNRSFKAEYRTAGEDKKDQQLVVNLMKSPEGIDEAIAKKLRPNSLLGFTGDDKVAKDADVQVIVEAMFALRKEKAEVNVDSILAQIDKTLLDKPNGKPQADTDKGRRKSYLSANVEAVDLNKQIAATIQRGKDLDGRLTFWSGMNSLMLNFGAFFGIYGFGLMTQRLGRRVAFGISFVLAAVATAGFFNFLSKPSDLFWMSPIMGFCQLSLFGGYAIYFPELFPTRLRSTGISFCYNVARYIAALGPTLLGLLTGVVFKDYPEPMRAAGITMCAVFAIGVLVLPFAPETRGQPLPED